MIIRWKECKSYDEAKNYRGIVYLHEWYGDPFYWGLADTTKFGGNRQKIDEDGHLNPRYGSSYKHWIEGCLRHGAKLYIGEPDGIGTKTLLEIEKQLIHDFPSELNACEETQNILIEHRDEKPLSVLQKTS